MFALKIHTVDFPRPLHTSITSAAAYPNENLKPSQLMGVAHLFRQLPSASTPPITVASISARTTLVYVVAVPNYLSADDFLVFCGNHVPHFQDILFLRNDGMEDRYSVLIKLENRLAAYGFYCSYNGKRFKPSEAEVCHIYFAQSVSYSESEEMASIPPPDYTELPSCPVCLERLDPDTSGIQSTLCDHSFHCSCVSKWTYPSCPVCRLCHQQDEKLACTVCGYSKYLWTCLICGFVGCGRYVNGHASGHWSDKHHRFSLDLEKPQIWDYVGEGYVHRLNHSKGDGKSVALNSQCCSVEECGTCGHGDEGLDGALFNSKLEGILDEYNHLLASEMDKQRRHYESLLAEAKNAKEGSIAKSVEKAIFSKMHDLEYKLENFAEEKKAVADRNQELMKKQEVLQKRFKEIEERDMSSNSRNSTWGNDSDLDLRYSYIRCHCNVEAEIKIVVKPESRGKLYVTCKKCEFFSWLEPTSYSWRRNRVEHGATTVEEQEVQSSKGRCESTYEDLHANYKDLSKRMEKTEGFMKIVVLLLLILMIAIVISK